MQISDVRAHVLRDPIVDPTATSSSQDTVLVEVVAEDGTTGIGESDVNPWIAQACIEAPGSHSMARSLRELIVGRDVDDLPALWEAMYVGSAMNGRRGAGIHAIGAVDIALHDLAGKLAGRSVSDLLGLEPRGAIRAYASLQPDVGEWTGYRRQLVADALDARARGFGAVKTSLTLAGPYAHKGLDAPWAAATDTIAELRDVLGADTVLMVDVQYAFASADEALGVLADWVDYDLFFVETPLWPDDLDGYARLATEQPVPIAAGEWLTTRHEFRDLIERGRITVPQPDIGRVGGLTEAIRVADLARAHDRLVVPHLWKTGISIAAALHFASVTPHCPFIEFLPAETTDSAIRRELLTRDFEIVDGHVAVPTEPGLGVEVDAGALEHFVAAAAAVA